LEEGGSSGERQSEKIKGYVLDEYFIGKNATEIRVASSWLGKLVLLLIAGSFLYLGSKI
jgi:hypothetical protein